MKKLATALCVVLVAFAFSAWAGTLTPGTYKGTSTSSILPEVNGQTATATVKTEGNKVIATVVTKDGTEVWTWDNSVLRQDELDAAGKVATTYSAKLVDGKYQVNCADRAKNICDAEIDASASWAINNTDNSFTYTYYNIAKNQKTNPTTQNAERIKTVFTLAK